MDEMGGTEEEKMLWGMSTDDEYKGMCVYSYICTHTMQQSTQTILL